MTNFYSFEDVEDVQELFQLASRCKNDPTWAAKVGKGKLLVLLFFNPSLRTKLSTQKAALNLGMQVIPMDMKSSWNWEFEDGVTMKFDTAEHVKEAANVISRYADIIAIRSFPSLTDKDRDYQDQIIQSFMSYASKPVVNLESATRHPLQSLADMFTIHEHVEKSNPKIVLTWAPHPKVLPQAVANSFLEWAHGCGHQVTVTHPKGYELDAAFMSGHQIEYDRKKALESADVVYVKNWSTVTPYGQVLSQDPRWMIDQADLQLTNAARLMHCLPVRRNVVIADNAMDSSHSVLYDLSENRLHTAQAVLYKLLSTSTIV
ncbi:MAG: acetylornithine carbamoyltransferase [Bacteroidota bacterium]